MFPADFRRVAIRVLATCPANAIVALRCARVTVFRGTRARPVVAAVLVAKAIGVFKTFDAGCRIDVQKGFGRLASGITRFIRIAVPPPVVANTFRTLAVLVRFAAAVTLLQTGNIDTHANGSIHTFRIIVASLTQLFWNEDFRVNHFDGIE